VNRATSFRRLGALAVTASALLIGPVMTADAQHGLGPFARLAGSWSGGGIIATNNGTRERIRCRASYQVGNEGYALQQNLRCASDSYRFDVNSDVRLEDGRLTGKWSETTRGVSGEVAGRVDRGQILATVTGPNFSAGLAIATRGKTQSVTIQPSSGAEITEVAVRLNQESDRSTSLR
jgi:hypothetical protein